MSIAQKQSIHEPVLTGEMAATKIQASIAKAEKDGMYVIMTLGDISVQTFAVHRQHNAGVHTISASYKKQKSN